MMRNVAAFVMKLSTTFASKIYIKREKGKRDGLCGVSYILKLNHVISHDNIEYC